jgi:hypothetical protein
MRFVVRVIQQADGCWLATHQSREAGSLTVRAATQDEAIEKMRGEIRYRLELCPCSGATWQHLALEVVADARGKAVS